MGQERLRLIATAAAVTLLLAACSGGASQQSSDPASADAVALPQAEASPTRDVPSALDDRRDPSFPPPLVDPDSFRSGGPPPDGIPAIDEPRFQRAQDVAWLDPAESVLSLTVGDETRGYPIQVMVWHEIVNDTVDDVPVAITYCPLCNSAVALDRRVDDLVLSFGTSGLLHNSDLVMYDRQTESLWPQLGFRAAVGALTGAEPEVLPISTLTWGEFSTSHPDAWVLSRDTGHSRDYGRNPYGGYDSDDGSQPFLFDGQADGRLAVKTHILGLFPQEAPVAITVAHLLDEGPITVDGPDGDVIVWARPDVRSPVDADQIRDGRQTGAGVAHEPVTTEGTAVELRRVGGSRGPLRDTISGSSFGWDGRATSGDLLGQRLVQVPATDTFWFAWAAFAPDTEVID